MELNKVEMAAKVAFASNVTLCLVGESGVAKTSIWGQIYKNLGFESYVIIRPAMIADAADLVGLPDFEVVEVGGKKIKTTKFMYPDWLPHYGQKVLIVVDEINRVQKDVANSFFGLIEAEGGTVGQYKLPRTCKVVATCNPPTDSYGMVLDITDSAWSSRLCFVKIAPSLDEFTAYGRTSGKIAPIMLDFLNKNEKYYGNGGNFEIDDFFGTNDEERGAHIKNNNRSKEKISNLYVNGTELGLDRGTLQELIQGIGGKEFSISFMQFAQNYNKIITLEQLLKDVNAHKDFDYSAMSNINKVLEDLKYAFENKKVKKKELANALLFVKNLPSDTLQGFITWVSSNSHKTEYKYLLEFSEMLVDDTEIFEKLKLIAQTRMGSNSKTEEKQIDSDDIPF